MTARERLANALLHEHLTTDSLGTLQRMLGDVSDELFEEKIRADVQRKYQSVVDNYAQAMAPMILKHHFVQPDNIVTCGDAHHFAQVSNMVAPYTDRQCAAAGDV